MKNEKLTIVFRPDTLKVKSAMQSIVSMLSGAGVSTAGFKLLDKTVDLSDAVSQLDRAQLETFNLAGHNYEFDLGRVRNAALDFLEIKYSGDSDTQWDEWAGAFIREPGFVMAWISDVEYEFWQNAYDPLQYQAHGKRFDHLPMKSNGLPYPLTQQIVDISHNPGRRVLGRGYYEAVGAVMWLGKSFWRLTEADRKKLEKTEWRTSEPYPSVIRLQAAEQCFTAYDRASVQVEKRLRALLFPTMVAV